MRKGMLAGFTLGHYLLLVDYTGRLFRDGKASISREVSALFERDPATHLHYVRCSESESGWRAAIPIAQFRTVAGGSVEEMESEE